MMLNGFENTMEVGDNDDGISGNPLDEKGLFFLKNPEILPILSQRIRYDQHLMSVFWKIQSNVVSMIPNSSNIRWKFRCQD